MEARVISLSLLLFLVLFQSSPAAASRSLRPRQPCKTLTLYIHDILYNGKNLDNSTSAIVAAPAWSDDRLNLGRLLFFGDTIVFDDPITLDNNLHSPPVGRAQGFYLYDGKKVPSAWFGFSIVLNSTQHRGTMNVVGADPVLETTRDLSVVGGTGDFFMTRGVATFTTDAIEYPVYFRVRVDVKLYECY